MAELSDRVLAWREAGVTETFRGRRIHVHRRPAEDAAAEPLVVFLHGFPSSSYDYRELLGRLPRIDALAFDFLGFGLSEKPRDHVYSLSWQADLTEELIDRHAADRPVAIVAHDMGTSVATELMARDLAGKLGCSLEAVLLFNGSIVVERASLTWVQRLLRSRLGPLAARLTSETLFRRQFSALFSEAHPLSEAEAADQWALLSAAGGHRMGDLLIGYIGERVTYAPRWHGAVGRWPGRLELAWGLEDPVATVDVLDALRELRPAAPVSELPGVGHYPQIEVPEALAEAVSAALSPLL